METRRLFFAMFAALTVYATYMVVYSYIRPQPAPIAATSTQPIVADPGGTPLPAGTPGTIDNLDGQPASSQPGPIPELDRGLGFASDPGAQPVTLGGREEDDLRVTLSPRGAAVGSIDLIKRKPGSEKYAHRETAAGNDPYTVIQPVQGSGNFESYVTNRVWITRAGQTQVWDLSSLSWNVAEARPDQVVFQTFLADSDIAQRRWGGPTAGPKPSTDQLRESMLVRLRKTYTLIEGKPLVMLQLAAENRTGQDITVAFEQFGPVGIPGEHIQYNMRFLVAAIDEDGQLSPESRDGTRLRKPASKGDRIHPMLTTGQDRRLAWTALTNKYFAVVTRPLPNEDGSSTIRKMDADVADYASLDDKRGDMRARLETLAEPIGPGQSKTVDFEIYAGSKAKEDLRDASPDFVDRSKLGYALLRDVDQRRCCTFASLTAGMTGLLGWIHSIVGNYGIAIMILVVIIRTVLHPLTVFQQKSMFRTQEGMGRIQPKLNELKKKYGEDRVKFNQEMMKLYSEENVNPAAPLVSMLPMMIQMPILIALWTGINTDIHLRHAIFDGWWIKDLSAPDALISFSQPISIPVLSWLPLIGFAFQNIPSINVLPVMMGISMWLQQKYMPKPHLDEKIKAAKQAREEGREPETGMGGMSVEDQVRQQQMIATMMAVIFPLMFYYMPAGLNLYWLATNVFGIFESLRVRKQLDAEKARKAVEGDAPPKKGGIMSGFFKKMAEQAEDVQRQFDEIAQQDTRKSGNKEAQERKKKVEEVSPALPDLHNLVIAAARTGGQVAADGFGGRLEIERKTDLSEVTQFDRAAERAIIDFVRVQRPNDVFLGEEAVGDSYRDAGDRLCWVIDPIDGTRNFTRRSPLFACSVGVLQHGHPLAGAIVQPLTGTCWSAWRDGGAYQNGVRLHSDNNPPLAPDRKLVVGIPSARHENSAAWVAQLVEQHVVRNLGSAALHLAMVASGQMDATLMNNCKLWDIAGGALLITESGGRLSDLDGNPRLPIDLNSYNGEMTPTFAAAPAAYERLLNERVSR